MVIRFKSAYEILGVPRDASDDDIKAAFRKQMRETHPDAHSDDPTATSRTQDINDAYVALGKGRDSEVRNTYDKLVQREEIRLQRIEEEKIREEELRRQQQKAENQRTSVSNSENNRSNPFHRPSGHKKSTFDPKDFAEQLNKVFEGRAPDAVRKQPEIRLAENDISLLSTLILAYQTKGENVWYVHKSKEDKRTWMPEVVFQVHRDERGLVTVYRTIKDWRDETHRNSDFKREEKTVSSNSLISETYFKGNNGRTIEGFRPVYKYETYLHGLKNLAHTLAHNKKEISPIILNEINFYVDSNASLIQMESSQVQTRDSNKDLGRTIPVNKLWDAIFDHSEYVEELTHWKKEGSSGSGGEGKF